MSEYWERCEHKSWIDLCEKCEIDRLRAEVERLRAERDRQYDQNAEQVTRIARLRAENEKLRAALREYVCNCPKGTCEYFPCGEFARAALDETSDE